MILDRGVVMSLVLRVETLSAPASAALVEIGPLVRADEDPACDPPIAVSTPRTQRGILARLKRVDP